MDAKKLKVGFLFVLFKAVEIFLIVLLPYLLGGIESFQKAIFKHAPDNVFVQWGHGLFYVFAGLVYACMFFGVIAAIGLVCWLLYKGLRLLVDLNMKWATKAAGQEWKPKRPDNEENCYFEVQGKMNRLRMESQKKLIEAEGKQFGSDALEALDAHKQIVQLTAAMKCLLDGHYVKWNYRSPVIAAAREMRGDHENV